MNVPPCDIVAFTAHPDDLELTCGGTMALSARQGWKAGAVDFTRGELGTRGTPEVRAEEAGRAAGILGLQCRVNLSLPDGHLHDSDDNRKAVVRLIRKLRPRVVISPPVADHHPDHEAVGRIVSRAFYLAGIGKYAEGDPPWRPHTILHYLGSRPAIPSLVVDVTSVYDVRLEAIRCFQSQFWQEGSSDPPTRISHPDFLAAVDAVCRRNGAFIGVAFGEAYSVEQPVPVRDLVSLYEKAPWDHRPSVR